MTDTKQTKCPHCGSTFRISDAQLAAKGGSVRCGSCLQVFRADQHLVGAAPVATTASAAAKPKTKDKGDESWALDLIGDKEKAAQGAPATGDDEFGFNDDEVDAFIDSGASVAAPPAQGKGLRFDDELSDLLDDAGQGLPLGGEEHTDRISESADESWAKDILSELADEEKQNKNKYGMELVDDKGKKAPKNPKLAAALGQRTDAGEDVFASLGAPAKAAPPRPAASRPADDFLSEDADVLGFLDEDDLNTSPTAAPQARAASNPFSLDRPLAHVEAPVVIKPRREPVAWGRLLTWTFLCLIAIAMFAAQYVYFNFDSLAINPKSRPVMEQACAMIQGCRLPDIPDPTRLKIKELVVRKHPKAADALQVDAILKNEATFPQPFPALHLRFSNSQDEVVASRILRPGEYLAGDAVFMRRMPPQTPIRISVSIVDPGKEAVSYSLNPVL